MKHIITRVIVLAAAAVVFGLQANAQVGQQYRAQVPFDFTANGRAYTAGSYSVGLLLTSASNGPISLVDRKNGHQRIIGMSRGQSLEGTKGKLTFVRNGKNYALVSISTPSFNMKAKEPERAIAAVGSEIIELALN